MPNSNDLLETYKYIAGVIGVIAGVVVLGLRGIKGWVEVARENSTGKEGFERLKRSIEIAQEERAEINRKMEKLSEQVKDQGKALETLRSTVSENMRDTMNLILRGTKQ